MEQAITSAVKSIRKSREKGSILPASPDTPTLATGNNHSSSEAAPLSESKETEMGAAKSESADFERHHILDSHFYAKFSQELVRFQNILYVPMYRVMICAGNDVEASYAATRRGEQKESTW